MFKKWISVNNHFLILMLQSVKSLNILFLSLSSILDCIKIIIGSLIIAPRFPPKIDYRTGTTGPKKPSKNFLLRLRFTSSTRSRSDRRRGSPTFRSLRKSTPAVPAVDTDIGHQSRKGSGFSRGQRPPCGAPLHPPVIPPSG